METKSLIIELAIKPFQQKGYKGVELNEIIKVCNISNSSLIITLQTEKKNALNL